MNSKICCIIPTHGAGDAFVDCIMSLVNQTLEISQIIIVDNNVKDGSIEKLLRINNTTESNPIIQNIPVKIVKLSTNSGVTGGRNAGIDALPVQYDYALFVDHDMILEKSCLQELVKTAENKQTIGIVTPKIYYWENKDIVWSAGTDINTTTGQTVFYGGKDKGQFEQEKPVAVAPAILLVKKSVIDSVKKFDEIYFATYEDTDFCFEAKIKGFETWYSPKSVAYHKIPFDPKTSIKRLLERTYFVGRNRYLFLRKFNLFTWLTVVYIPVYAVYYTYLGLKYQNSRSIIEYFKGIYAGLSTKLKAV